MHGGFACCHLQPDYAFPAFICTMQDTDTGHEKESWLVLTWMHVGRGSSFCMLLSHPFVPCKTRAWVMRRNLGLSWLECMSGEGVHFACFSLIQSKMHNDLYVRLESVFYPAMHLTMQNVYACPYARCVGLSLRSVFMLQIHTLGFLEKAARRPLPLFVSEGIKRSLKATGRDSKRDLNIPSVLIWFGGQGRRKSLP
jgi:hypothetical protein